MANLHYKYESDDPRWVNLVYSNAFIVDERNSHVHYCEEFDIIKKIQRNEEGFFDFSKNLIDIGAEDGNYALLLDFKHNYCFEPNKKACCLMYANMFLKDKVDNTEVYNIGLSDHEGMIKFDGFTCEPDHPDGYSSTGIYNIPIKTLDSFNIENVGLIKIDVEGYEENVLLGGIDTIIRNNYPPILFECWDVDWWGMTQEKHDRLFNILNSLGYEILEHWGDHETHLAIHK